MRPRLLHLGYGEQPHPGRLALSASMRPRLLHLGYPSPAVAPPMGSDSFNEAEAFTPRIHHDTKKADALLYQLQ